MIKIYCAHCWTIHYAESLAWWIERGSCGKDPEKLFLNYEDYISFVRGRLTPVPADAQGAADTGHITVY